MQNDLIQAPTRPVLAIPELAPEMERSWEGNFHANFLFGKTYIVPVRAVMRLYASMIDGRGLSLTFPTNGTRKDRRFELTGTRQGSNLMFEIWFTGKLGHRPWKCEGELNAAEAQIKGQWTFACFHPDSCGCAGADGPFELKRCR